MLLLQAVAIVAAPPPGPSIGTPSISPSSPGPNDQVTVTATVTAGNSGVKNVTVVYSTDSWKTNTTVVASYNSTSQLATAHIPPQRNGGQVQYYLVAFDGNNNRAVNNNNGSYYSYTVAAPPPSTAINTWIELALIAATLGVGGTIAFYSLRSRTKAGSTAYSQT